MLDNPGRMLLTASVLCAALLLAVTASVHAHSLQPVDSADAISLDLASE